MDNTAGRAEYAHRTEQMRQRQYLLCPACTKYLREGEATFDHEIPRGMGGANQDDRIWIDSKPANRAVHEWCNSQRGSKRLTCQQST